MKENHSQMVTRSKHVVTVASRMIIELEKQGLCLGTGNWQARTAQALGTVVVHLRKTARGKERVLRSVAQMLERWVETLKMIAWKKQTRPHKSVNPTTWQT